MSTANINVSTDSETKARAQHIFSTLGLDLDTAINLFLRQTVRMNDMPFVLTMQIAQPAQPENALKTSDNSIRPPFEYGSIELPAGKLPFGRGCMKGKMWMADDFDAPLEDFKDYME